MRPCGLIGETFSVIDQCFTENGWDFSNYDIDKTATALVSSSAAGAAGCAIAFCAGGIAIEVGRELAVQLGVQAGTRMFAAISSGIGGALVGSVSGPGARYAEALTYNAMCDLIGCPEYKMSFGDIIDYTPDADAICLDALMGFCTYAASAAYLYRPANNQGISVSEGAHCYDNSGINERPTWRQSELDAADAFSDYTPQASFKNGEKVAYGTKGSVRPDLYKENSSIDVKNYNIEKQGSSNLVANIGRQYEQRIKNLPTGTKQTVLIDIRGQIISSAELDSLYQKVIKRTYGGMNVLFKK